MVSVSQLSLSVPNTGSATKPLRFQIAKCKVLKPVPQWVTALSRTPRAHKGIFLSCTIRFSRAIFMIHICDFIVLKYMLVARTHLLRLHLGGACLCVPFGLAFLFQTVQWPRVCQDRAIWAQFGLNDTARYLWVILLKLNMDFHFLNLAAFDKCLVLQFNQLDVFVCFSFGVCRRHVVVVFLITHQTWIQSIRDVRVCVCLGNSHEFTRSVAVR